jgi:hypothetical protein
MKKFLRQLYPGQVFLLLRSGETYQFLRRDHQTPSGTRYVVFNMDRNAETTLHHSCHVWVSQKGILGKGPFDIPKLEVRQ